MLTAVLLLAAADVSVEVEVPRPLKVTKGGELKGVLTVRIKNRGTEAVRLQHRDVHGFRFAPAGGGAPSVIFHSCDCGFELGLDRPPDKRTFSLEPQQELLLRFDDFTCGGGPHRAPAPGRYKLTYQVGVPVDPLPPAKKGPLDFKECERLLVSRPAQPHQSAAIDVELRR